MYTYIPSSSLSEERGIAALAVRGWQESMITILRKHKSKHAGSCYQQGKKTKYQLPPTVELFFIEIFSALMKNITNISNDPQS